MQTPVASWSHAKGELERAAESCPGYTRECRDCVELLVSSTQQRCCRAKSAFREVCVRGDARELTERHLECRAIACNLFRKCARRPWLLIAFVENPARLYGVALARESRSRLETPPARVLPRAAASCAKRAQPRNLGVSSAQEEAEEGTVQRDEKFSGTHRRVQARGLAPR